MKKLALATLLLGTLSWADRTVYKNNEADLGPYNRTLASESQYTHGITPSLGLSQGRLVGNIDYEYRLTNNFGFGGYFGITPEKTSKALPGLVSFGADFKAHVSIESLDFYVRPGIGLGLAKYRGTTNGVADTDSSSKSFLAPELGIGAVYRIAEHVAVGVEHVQIFNWTEDSFPAKVEAFLVAVQIRF